MSDDTTIKGFSTNATITNALIQSVEACFSMCELKVRVVGVTKIPMNIPSGVITGMIGVHGKCSGFITLEMTERASTLAVSGLLQDEFRTINNQVIDGVGELTNIIAGGIKSKMYNSEWTVSTITIPSVILSNNYNISYSKGIEFVSITFEIDDPETHSIQNRIFMVTASLMQVS
jgi:chemotaxis protein CheX